jgi:hypothetical protein
VPRVSHRHHVATSGLGSQPRSPRVLSRWQRAGGCHG